jgi:hypothetical protein
MNMMHVTHSMLIEQISSMASGIYWLLCLNRGKHLFHLLQGSRAREMAELFVMSSSWKEGISSVIPTRACLTKKKLAAESMVKDVVIFAVLSC